MPREIVHWSIIQAAVSRLNEAEHRTIRHAALRYPDALALGAVAHDAPYYFRGGGAPFEHVGSLLHGLGDAGARGDTKTTHEHIGALALQLSSPSLQEKALAFLLGLLSHYAADVVFHPFIFFFTGDYYAPDDHARHAARGRHRLIEVYLDEHVRSRGAPFPWSTEIVSLERGMDKEALGAICQMLGEAVAPLVAGSLPHGKTQLAHEWRRSIHHMALFQRFFVSPLAGSLAQALKAFRPERFGQYEALFASGRTGRHPVFDGPLEFLNPVTGEGRLTTLKELEAEAVDLTCQLARTVEDSIRARSPLKSTLCGGRSLNYGIPRASPEGAAHFSARGLNLPGLRF